MNQRPNTAYWTGFWIILTLMIMAPLVLPEFWRRFVTEILIWGLLAMSSDILIGYAGMVSFGHSAFFGLGMYGAAAALLTVEPPNLLLAIACGLIGSAGIAVFVAYFSNSAARHLFHHHDPDLFADFLRRHLDLDRGDRGRERAHLCSTGAGYTWVFLRSLHVQDATLVRACGGDGLVPHPTADHSIAFRHGLAIDPRK